MQGTRKLAAIATLALAVGCASKDATDESDQAHKGMADQGYNDDLDETELATSPQTPLPSTADEHEVIEAGELPQTDPVSSESSSESSEGCVKMQLPGHYELTNGALTGQRWVPGPIVCDPSRLRTVEPAPAAALPAQNNGPD